MIPQSFRARSRQLRRAGLTAALALSALGCGDDGSPAVDAGEPDGSTPDAQLDANTEPAGDAGAGQDAGNDASLEVRCDDRCVPVTVEFAAQSGDTPVSCTAPITVGQRSQRIDDFRFYVSEVELIADDGSRTPLVLDDQVEKVGAPAYQVEQVALLDFEDATGTCKNGNPTTNSKIVGRAQPGTYTGIAFSLGVPEALNHLNAATAKAPLNLTALWWTWKIGYMFTLIELHPAADTSASDLFRVHLGSAGCSGDPSAGMVVCEQPNRARIELTGFDPSTQRVVLDLDGLLADIDVAARAEGDTPGCMAEPEDAECTAIHTNLGLDPSTGKAGTAAQRAFRVAEQ
jgi:uncharacterized repeat protein (TIGR04052 family)